MSKKCNKCGRYVDDQLKNGQYVCPWMPCGHGVDIVDGHNYSKADVPYFHKPTKISIILPYAFSPDPLRQLALRRVINCLGRQTFSNYELIVVEDTCGRGMGVFPFAYAADKYIVVDDPKHKKFNKSWLMNIGARAATTEHLIFHDADIIYGKTYLQVVVESIKKNKVMRCWSQFWTMRGKDNPVRRNHCETSLHCLAGVWYCNRITFFENILGYCEDYFGYGREDSDIWFRTKHLMGGTIPSV